ncbi:MAG: hypothetical protein J5850_03875 [Clostridia bacterium]|nr:hypothetical protein [Clostridia bacterium]
MRKFLVVFVSSIIMICLCIPCLAVLREDGNGEWTSEGNDQAHWIDGLTTKHFKVEGDFNDMNNGMNGCVGFMIGEFPEDKPLSESTAFCFFAAGFGSAGYTSHGKWWTQGPQPYTTGPEEGLDRFCHIEVEWMETDEETIIKCVCNDREYIVNLQEMMANDSRFEGLEPYSAKSVVIAEKIKDGKVKNLKFTDLEAQYELKNNCEWTVEDNVYSAPKFTNGDYPEYYYLGQGEDIELNFAYSPNPYSSGVMFGIKDVNRDGTIDTSDRYYFAAVNDNGTSVGIKRVNRAYSPWTIEITGLEIKEGDRLTFKYKKENGTISIAVNGKEILTYTDENKDEFTGDGYAFGSTGEAKFVTVGQDYSPPEEEQKSVEEKIEYRINPIFIAIAAVCGLVLGAVITLICVKIRKK